MFTVFKRRWWKDNPDWPNGLEPDPTARKTVLATKVDDPIDKASKPGGEA